MVLRRWSMSELDGARLGGVALTAEETPPPSATAFKLWMEVEVRSLLLELRLLPKLLLELELVFRVRSVLDLGVGAYDWPVCLDLDLSRKADVLV